MRHSPTLVPCKQCHSFVNAEQEHMKQVPIRRGNQALEAAKGLNNLLYSADVDFSCFADLALTSPVRGIPLQYKFDERRVFAS